MIQIIFITIFIRYLIFLLRVLILISFHPIFIGVLILIFCLFLSVTISLLTHSWLSFLIFYLMSGGILILLIYISCYSFNPLFKRFSYLTVSFLLIIILLFQYKLNFFILKKRFRVLILIESGIGLSYHDNLNLTIIISLLIFLCFFNIRKILISISFSIRKFFLRRNIRAANS